jgi:hypothetical protein
VRVVQACFHDATRARDSVVDHGLAGDEVRRIALWPRTVGVEDTPARKASLA